MQAHFAVSAWFLFIGEGEAAGMLPLQDGSHKDCLPSYVFFLVVFYAISYRRKGS